jgi:hypothetical protein
MREFHKQFNQPKRFHLQNDLTEEACYVQIDEILDLLAAMMRKNHPIKACEQRTDAEGNEEIRLGDFQN